MKKFEWQITKAESIKDSKELKFWLVDYYDVEVLAKKVNTLPLLRGFSFMKYTMCDLRNKEFIRTAYFEKKEDAWQFIDELSKGVDRFVLNTVV